VEDEFNIAESRIKWYREVEGQLLGFTTEQMIELSKKGVDFWVDRVVQQDSVGDFFVSTVFLVLDHGWNGPPVLWETAVFNKNTINEMDRYTSRIAALAGHLEMVSKYSKIKAAER
jgi:hypothetical protein